MADKRQTSIPRIGIEELKPRVKNILFVDAPSATALARNPRQVPGAVHIPIKALDEKAGRLPRDCTIVTYCT
jgi:rhodanese-related sulfurtransferase